MLFQFEGDANAINMYSIAVLPVGRHSTGETGRDDHAITDGCRLKPWHAWITSHQSQPSRP